ncbi:MAG: Asp-tRNA(Asn)/Glu-tRNA(Gln) amidotransferase subunit GatC [Patescibacteria group bacterium]|jgi:aspartyl-tRNA(Asn)/glutamyl-tRNA(Gln) amidotransferase subunit C
MPISLQHVEHIARLARIRLTEDEKEPLRMDLAAILGFVEKLNEVETADIPPMTGGTTLVNIQRADKDARPETEHPATLLSATPETQNGYVKVKQIFTAMQ